jgi:hypothetical protein
MVPELPDLVSLYLLPAEVFSNGSDIHPPWWHSPLHFAIRSGKAPGSRCMKLLVKGKTVRFRHKPVLAVCEGCGDRVS